MKKFKGSELLKSATFWILAVAFTLAAVTIFLGHHLFDTFEQLTLRLLVGFSVFFGTVMGVLVYTLYFKEETQKKLRERKALRARDKESSDIVDARIKDLKARFVEATKIIKTSSIYKKREDANYELPWYLMVGRETEGKTALLESSGLEFPLNINYDNRTVTEEGTTKSFQWYFAEHAIFVDMPGSYIGQKEDSIEADVWKAFLRLFKKQRWKRPINGVVLTISIDTIMGKTERELEQYAKELRDRFDELSDTFMSTVPIYMFVTKTDKVPGFQEYFASLSDSEKDEVLGMTFDDRENIDSSVIQPELDAMIKRLNGSVFDRMHQEWDHSARSKILLFCDEFSALFEKLKIFIDIGFAQTRYRAPLLLRGIYFTSVPQTGTPVYENALAKPDRGALPESGSGKGLFIKKVLKKIIFPEADIIKMDTTYRQQQKTRQRIAFAVSTAAVAFVTLLWVQDFNRHNDTLDALEDMVKSYSQERAKLHAEDDFEQSLYLLNKLYAAKGLDDLNASERFWKLVFYKHEARQQKMDTLYYTALEKVLLPYVGTLIEKQVRSNLEDYDMTWESTKTYLMLNSEENRNADFLTQWMASAWSHLYPNKLTIQKDLNDHWHRLLAHGFTPYELNKETLSSARNKLLGYGHEALVYKQLKDKARESGLDPFQFSQVMGSNTASFTGNDYVIPGFYTKAGYEKIIVENGKELIRDLVRSNWVVGYTTELSEAELNELYAKVQSFYFTDYKKHWFEALNALQIPQETTISQISNQLTVLTSGDSPIIAVLKALKNNTELYTPSEKLRMQASQKMTETTSKVASVTDKVMQSAAEVTENTSVKNVREFFKEFHQLLSKDGQAAGTLKIAMSKLEKAYQETTAMNGSVSPHKDAFEIVMARINGQHAPVVMKSSSLPIPVDKWIKKALRNDWEYIIAQSKHHINDRYKTQVYAYYKEKLAGKYPLSPEAKLDVTLLDFEEFFKKGGVIDQFYTQYVSPFVNINHLRKKYGFRNIDGTRMHFDQQFIDSLFVMNDIRKRFFDTKGDVLGTTLYVKPNQLGRNLATMALHYDNNYIGYEHGPVKSRKISWPAETETPDAKFQLLDLGSNQVVSYSDEGEWGLYRLFSRMSAKQYRSNRGSDSIVIEYNNSEYKAGFALTGPSVGVFSKANPLKKYRLRRSI